MLSRVRNLLDVLNPFSMSNMYNRFLPGGSAWLREDICEVPGFQSFSCRTAMTGVTITIPIEEKVHLCDLNDVHQRIKKIKEVDHDWRFQFLGYPVNEFASEWLDAGYAYISTSDLFLLNNTTKVDDLSEKLQYHNTIARIIDRYSHKILNDIERGLKEDSL